MMRRAIVWTLALGMLFGAACAAEVQPTEQPSPTPTYTPTATHASTPTATPSPTVTRETTPTSTPRPTRTPTPIPTLLMERLNFTDEKLNPEEQAEVNNLVQFYEEAVRRLDFDLASVKLVVSRTRDRSFSGYIVWRTRVMIWIEEVGDLVSLPVFQGRSAEWDADLGAFVYHTPEGEKVFEAKTGAIVSPEVYDIVSGYEQGVQIPGIEHVRFAGFSEERLKVFSEAGDLVRRYAPERFDALVQNIDWIIFCPGPCTCSIAYPTVITCGWPLPFRLPLKEQPSEITVLMVAAVVWGHELEHRLQELDGRMPEGPRPLDVCLELETEAFAAQRALMQRLRLAISEENQGLVDWEIDRLGGIVDGTIPHPSYSACAAEAEQR